MPLRDGIQDTRSGLVAVRRTHQVLFGVYAFVCRGGWDGPLERANVLLGLANQLIKSPQDSLKPVEEQLTNQPSRTYLLSPSCRNRNVLRDGWGECNSSEKDVKVPLCFLNKCGSFAECLVRKIAVKIYVHQRVEKRAVASQYQPSLRAGCPKCYF